MGGDPFYGIEAWAINEMIEAILREGGSTFRAENFALSTKRIGEHLSDLKRRGLIEAAPGDSGAFTRVNRDTVLHKTDRFSRRES
jgi:hypothetical protein